VKNLRAAVAMAIIFVIVQLAAIAFIDMALGPQEQQVFENPEDPLIALYYIILMLGFTAIFLLLIKLGRESLIRAIFLVSVGFVIFFVAISSANVVLQNEAIVLIVGISLGSLSVLGIWVHPEWYVIDSVGLAMSIGIVALLGISLSILPVLILLIGLAVYDAIAVYKTKHMLTLAEGVIDMGLPILLVVPKALPYSYRDNKPKILREKREEREAFLMGLGDFIIPGLLPASAFWFIETDKIILGMPGNLLIALSAIAGAVIGLLVIMKLLSRGDPHHPGLPFLNIGAMAGYFISYFVVFGLDLSQII